MYIFPQLPICYYILRKPKTRLKANHFLDLTEDDSIIIEIRMYTQLFVLFMRVWVYNNLKNYRKLKLNCKIN